MKFESIASAIFAVGTALSAWYDWPFYLTAGCAAIAAITALIAGAHHD